MANIERGVLFRVANMCLCLVGMKIHQILYYIITEMLVNDPVHQLETGEGDGKEHAAVLVYIRGRHTEHFVQLLHVALWIGWGNGWDCGWGWHRNLGQGRGLGIVLRGWRWGFFVVTSHNGWWHASVHTVLAFVMVTADDTFPRTAFAVHLGITDFEVNGLEWTNGSV